MATVDVVAGSPPTVEAAGFPQAGPPPLTVQFDSTAQATDQASLEFAWDFESDGTPDSATEDPDHIYAADIPPGAYQAIVSVTDSGSRTAQDSVPITLTHGPVWAWRQFDSDGGVLEFVEEGNPYSGTALDLPESGLSAETVLAICDPTVGGPVLPDDTVAVICLEPRGLFLGAPAIVTAPLLESIEPSVELSLLRYDPLEGLWIDDGAMEFAPGLGAIQLEVTQLTTYAVVAKAGDPPPVNGGYLAPILLTFLGLHGSGNDDGGGPCFIATAAYGTPLAPEIHILRDFRDSYLLTNAPGTAFVDIYYRLSPPLAEHVAKNAYLAAGVRLLLRPVIVGADHATANHPLWVAGVAGFLGILIGFAKPRGVRRP